MRSPSFVRRAWRVPLALVLTGCASSHRPHAPDAGPAPRPGPSDAATAILPEEAGFVPGDAAPPYAPGPACPAPPDTDDCPGQLPTCRYTGVPGGLLLEAASFGSGARFVALVDDTLLVELADGAPVLAQTVDADTGQKLIVRQHVVALRGERALDLGSIVNATTYSAEPVLLVCAESGRACRLLRSTGAGPDVELGRFPAEFEARGLVQGDSTCAFGRGLVCLGPEASALVPTGGATLQGAQLVASTGGVALGDDGALWLDFPADGTSIDLGGEAGARSLADVLPGLAGGAHSVQAMHIDHDRLTLVVDGALHILHADGAHRACALGSTAPVATLVASQPVLADGRVLTWDEECGHYCVSASYGPMDAIIDTDVATCGIQANPRLLGAQRLYGSSGCASD